MAFSGNRKDTTTYIENGRIIRRRADGTILLSADETPPTPKAQQVIDLDGKLHTSNETYGAMTAREREKAALHAMKQARPNLPIASKTRPMAASSSSALEADQKRLEEEQTAAFNEDPIPPALALANVNKHTPPSSLDEKNDPYNGLTFTHSYDTTGNEAIPGLFPNGIPQVILSYWGGDIAKLKNTSQEIIAHRGLLFFGKPKEESVLVALEPTARKVATAFLGGGEEEEVEDAIALVKECPQILHCGPVIARDRSGSPGFRLMTNEIDAELKKGENYLYLKRAEDGGLDYQLLGLDGSPVRGHITPKELGQEIEKATLFTLLAQFNQLRGIILDITAKRKHTPLGRAVKGKILQIAAMAGDVNLQEGMEEDKLKQAEAKEQQAKTSKEKEVAKIEKETLEKQYGIVERLAAIEGGLSKDEVAAQLEEAVTGEQAKQHNQQKVDRIMAAIKQFGEGILSKAKEYKEDKEDENNFLEFQAICQPLIDQLEKALQYDPKEITTSGYIFDESILYKAADWFEYGYELCLMPKQPDDKLKLEKGKLYLEEKEGCIAYSVITPDGKEVRHIKINELKASQPFDVDELSKTELKEKIIEAAVSAQHIDKNINRFGDWSTIMSSVFWTNGFGKLQTKLSARGQDVVRHGIGNVADLKIIPWRGVWGRDGRSLINLSSGCGGKFFVDCLGRREIGWSGVKVMVQRRDSWEAYIDQKQQRCKTYATSSFNRLPVNPQINLDLYILSTALQKAQIIKINHIFKIINPIHISDLIISLSAELIEKLMKLLIAPFLNNHDGLYSLRNIHVLVSLSKKIKNPEKFSALAENFYSIIADKLIFKQELHQAIKSNLLSLDDFKCDVGNKFLLLIGINVPKADSEIHSGRKRKYPEDIKSDLANGSGHSRVKGAAAAAAAPTWKKDDAPASASASDDKGEALQVPAKRQKTSAPNLEDDQLMTQANVANFNQDISPNDVVKNNRFVQKWLVDAANISALEKASTVNQSLPVASAMGVGVRKP